MLLKLLWIVVIAWIAHRVFIAAGNLLRIATGRDGGEGLPGQGAPRHRPPEAPGQDRTAPSPPQTARKGPEVEDARWVDL